MEKWKVIAGYPYYEVSNYGRVRSKDKYVNCGSGYAWKRGRIIKSHPNRDGYLMLRIRNSPLDKKFVAVHILVAVAFVENINGMHEVNHKDGIKSNNHADNLEWVSRSGNLIHALNLGLRSPKKGEESNLSKFKSGQILRIRLLYDNENYTLTEISKMYNTTVQCISAIVKRKTWKHI